ncbi:MAG: CBS domain-containing protein [Vicinamibacteria bacterium]
MKVERLMKTDVNACRPDDTGNCAARIMWERDCGFVPVVDERERVLAVVTDRDLCIAAYTQGKPLQEITLRSVMSQEIFSCQPDDDLAEAQTVMRERQVRRLPVTDAEGRLKGILSLSDITREAAKEAQSHPKKVEVSYSEVAETLAGINIPRTGPQATLH